LVNEKQEARPDQMDWTGPLMKKDMDNFPAGIEWLLVIHAQGSHKSFSYLLKGVDNCYPVNTAIL